MPYQPAHPKQRRQRLVDIYNTSVRPSTPDYIDKTLTTDKQRAKYTAGFTGKGSFARGVGRLGMIRAINPSYSQPEDQLRDYSLGELDQLERGESNVNLREGDNPLRGEASQYASAHLGRASLDDSPMLASLSKYTRERLGTGLTPQETAAIRGQNVEAVQAAAGEQRRQMANQFAGSGLDARAQSAAMGRLANETMQGRAGVERFVTEKELERKKDIEGLGANVSQMELARLAQSEDFAGRMADLGERSRGFNVEAEERRRGMIEDRLMKLSDLANARREYDLGFIQSRREAKKNRELMAKMRRDAEPGGLETAASVLGGIRGGLSMGG
jgi:hypothetical protein